MKKNLRIVLIASLGLFYFVSTAQPTITATGCNPVIGDHFDVVFSDYVNPGNSGVNQTWDLSSMAGTSSTITDVVSSSSTPYALNFPSSNIAFNSLVTNSSANTYTYYKTDSSVKQDYGFGNVSQSAIYSDPEDIMRFPYTYNDTYTDSWSRINNMGANTQSGYGTTNYTADGYGTLNTPAGTFTNVLRIHSVQNFTDSLYAFGMSFVSNCHQDAYYWYKDGIHCFLAYTTSFTTNNGTPWQEGGYLSDPTITTEVNDESAAINEYFLSPNPVAEKIKLSFSLTESKKVSVNIFNALGQNVQSEQTENGTQGSNTIELNVEALPEGIYFAQIIVDGKIAGTKRFVVSK